MQFFQNELPRDQAGRFTNFKIQQNGQQLFHGFFIFCSKFFQRKSLNFFLQMPDASGVYGTMCKVKKEENLF